MYRTFAAVVAVAALASPVVAAGTADATGKKQRIAIEERFNALGSTGSWRVTPLTPGRLDRDSGSLSYTGNITGTAMRNGARVNLIRGRHTLTGRGGTVTVSHRVESADVRLGSGYSADVGTWKVVGGTGSYAGLTGGGRLAAVAMPNGTVFVRQEGWVVAPN
jgi:hypothetical protein